MSEQSLRVEIAVIGGGPAGTSAALTIARAGASVVIIDRIRTNMHRPGEALSPSAAYVLRCLGRSDLVAANHLPAFGVRACWGSAALSYTDFVFSPYGHGWHLDRQVFDADGLSCARSAGIKVLQTRHAIRMEWTPGGVMLCLRDHETRIIINAAYLIDCSGRSAVAAASLGIRRIKLDRLVAASVLLRPLLSAAIEDEDATTTIEAVPDGWWYTCRVPSGARMLTFLTDADLLTPRAGRASDFIGTRLDRTEHMKVLCAPAAWRQCGPVQFCAANSSYLPQVSGDRWLAAGDAAFAFDPLSAIGMLSAATSGRRSAEAALGLLQQDFAAVSDYIEGATLTWRQYVRELWEQYGHEQRWPTRPFWLRRHGSPPQ